MHASKILILLTFGGSRDSLDSDNTHIVDIKNLSYFSITIFIKPVVLSILLFFLTLLLFVIWQQDVR